MRVARAVSILAVALVPLVVLGCEDDALCEPGEPCVCANSDACWFECSGDGCNMNCHGLVNCGAVCDNDCTLECHDVSDCSSSCGGNCTVDCHNIDDCGVICGGDCDVRCESAARCGVRAGPNSNVDCSSVGSCAD